MEAGSWKTEAGSRKSERTQFATKKCPERAKEFSPGQMVREFDEVVFKEAVGEVHGPVRTQFGFHLIEITSRTD